MGNILVDPVGSTVEAMRSGASGALQEASRLGKGWGKIGKSIAGTPGEFSGGLLGASAGALGGFVMGTLRGALGSDKEVSSTTSQVAADQETHVGGLPQIARSAGMEELFIVYSRGTGKFSDTGPPYYINLEVDLYDFSGEWVGYESGVNLSLQPPQASLKSPDPPPLPIGEPPVPPNPAIAWTKGLFTFNDGALIVEGPAQTHLTPLKDGSFLFSVTTSHMITGGTGLYEGARGTKQATGTALVPRELVQSGKFPSAGLQFPVTTIETFRLIRKHFLEEAASGGARGTRGTESRRLFNLTPGGPLAGGPLKK